MACRILGRSVKAALWRNETDKGTFFNIAVGHGPALERPYKDGVVWKSAINESSFPWRGFSGLASEAFVTAQAYTRPHRSERAAPEAFYG